MDPAYSWLWRAWSRLSEERPWFGGGMGPAAPGAIPWRALREWAEEYRLTVEEFDLLDEVVMVLDAQYRKHATQQAVKAAKERPNA